MKFKIQLLLCLICFSSYSQNLIFKIDDKNWEVSPKIVLNNDENKKFKIKFSSLDDGKYFVINRLLYGNKTAKVLAYFKEFDVYVIREAYNLKYLSFEEAFPKGGFYKDGGLKTIYGQKAERYALDNDVLDFKIWITDGVQEQNDFVGFLNNIGLTRNIPKTKKVIALSIQGLELDMSDIKMTIENGRTASNLEDILVSFKEKEDTIRDCIKALAKTKDSIISEFDTKIARNFPYKIVQKSTYYNRLDKKTQNFASTSYSSADGTLQLYLFPESNESGANAQLYDYNLMKMYDCKYIDDRITVLKARVIPVNQCDEKLPKFLTTSNNYNFYYTGKQSTFYIVKYELDEKNYPTLTNWKFKNGFIKGYTTLDKYLNQETATRTLEQGTFTFNFSK